METKKRTKPLTRSLTEMVARRSAAVIAERRRERCTGCGSFLTVQRECRNPDCEGQRARW